MKAYDTLWGYCAGDQWLAESTGLRRTPSHGSPPREPEIKAEPEQRREPAPEMVSTIQIPDDILAAVAEADAARGPEAESAPAPTAEAESEPHRRLSPSR